MNQNASVLTRVLFFIAISNFLVFSMAAQKPKLPPGKKTNQQIIQPASPVISRDSLVIVTQANTVTANTNVLTADQLFLKNGSFLIHTNRDYRYLTMKDDLSKSTVVHQYIPWYQEGQLWTLVPKPNGYYKIRSGTGLFLEMGGRSIYYVISKPDTETDKQLWQLESENGSYYIKSKSGLYLGVFLSQVKDNSAVGLQAKQGNNFQRWQLIKMTNDGSRITTFDPVRHGFRFINTFNGEDFIRWGGLCGGMVYSALDYHRTGRPIPTQSYTPANATPLQSYIYQRQQHSMWNVNEKWSELEIAYNTRAGEIYRWGIQGFGGGRLEELKNAIDAGRSVPLGLFGGGVPSIDGGSGGNHVVLAVGYAMGRYRGDFNGYPGDFKILVYDPNFGQRLITLVPNIEGQCFFEVETGKVWRTYFVNTKYDNEHTPPGDIPNFPEGEPEGSIRHLYATFYTGGDDLRGNNDNVHVTVHYRDGSTQVFPNVNGLVRWVDNSEQTVHLGLNRAVRKSDIIHFTLTTTFGDGFDSDDWNLDGIRITNGAGGILFAESFGTPIFRFSGDQHRQRFSLPVR